MAALLHRAAIIINDNVYGATSLPWSQIFALLLFIAVCSSNALITDEQLHSLDCQVVTAEAASGSDKCL